MTPRIRKLPFPNYVVLAAATVAAIVFPLLRLSYSRTPTRQGGETTALYRVVNVVDGDTVSVRVGVTNETVRFIGIDTPESVDPRKPVQCFGREASARTKSLVGGKEVRLVADASQGERDKYGRLLRYVELADGTDVNLALVRDGYAHEYTYRIPYARQDAYRQAEREAREGKRGLWADGACAAAVSPWPTAAPTVENGQGFSCSVVKKACVAMRSCAEATYYLTVCGVQSLDEDRDGTPCETLCR